MMLSRLWVLLLLLSYSFSVHAYSFGYTPNVAISGLEWTMTPTYLGANGIGGMDVSGVTTNTLQSKTKKMTTLLLSKMIRLVVVMCFKMYRTGHSVKEE